MNTRKYEAFYIVRPALNDGEVQAIADRFNGFVEAQGGTIGARNRAAGPGAAFRVTFPRAQVVAAPSAIPEEAP